MGNTVSLTIDGVRLEITEQENVLGELETVVNKIRTQVTVETREGTTVLEAAREAGLYIPALCADPDLKPYGGCRLCLVEIEDRPGLHAACTTPVAQGIVVHTDTERVNEVRHDIMQLMRTEHFGECLLCPKYKRCDMQTVMEYLSLGPQELKNLEKPATPVDSSNPFFNFDRGKCILCAKCVRACDELQGATALSLTYRGLATAVSTFADKPWIESRCESCGLCVAKCPTASLIPKDFKWVEKEVKTICPYCGIGCGLYLAIDGNNVVGVRGDPESPVNKGSLCVKGRFGLGFVNHPDRLSSPLIRRNGNLEKATWDEALDLVAGNLAKYKGEEVAVISSAKCTNEENYIIQKFARVVLGTNNIDHSGRLCHVPTIAGLTLAFGSGAMTNPIDNIGGAACILAIGTNTTATHPIIGLEIRKAVKMGTKLIVANPRHVDLCRIAHLWLRHQPGTDMALLMGMMQVIVDESLADSSFIEEHCENFNAFKQCLESFSPDFVEQVTGVLGKQVAEAARLYATNKPAVLLYATGITQHAYGTENVLATANLAMLTGNVGKPLTGVYPLAGQNNVQGAFDMGCLPDSYTGYQRIDDDKARQKFEASWGCSLSPSPGLTLTEVFEAAHQGQIKALYLVGANPLLSEPASGHVLEALQKLDFLVVQDTFLSETAQLAHVVLPAATFAEKDGCFTNTERRIQRLHQAIRPVASSQPDSWITCQIAQRMNRKGFDFAHPSQMMEEIASLTPSYGGVSFERLEEQGLQWPCPATDHPGTPILYTGGFDKGKGTFTPLEYRPPAASPDSKYPLVLTTERSLYQYQTGTLSRRVAGLNVLKGQEVVEMNPQDAEALGIADGETVNIVSERGELTTRAKITAASPPGLVSMAGHFADNPINVLTDSTIDPVAKTPGIKVCAVRVERVKT